MKRYLFTAVIATVVAAAGQHAYADDIDIYTNPTAAAVDAPVVMFTLDYRSNLGSTVCNGGACAFLTSRSYTDDIGNSVPYLTLTGGTTSYFNLLRGALKYVLQEVGPSGVKIGLAINHENNINCEGPTQTGCSNGGYIMMGAKQLKTQAERDAFYAKLDSLPVPGGSVAHPYQGKELFFELFRYFSSQGWYNMKNGWRDRGTTNSFNINEANDYSPADATAPASWDASVVSGANYISPVTSNCSKLYTVNVLFQVSQQESDSDNAIKAAAASGGMGGINLQGANNSFNTVIKWMYDNDNGPAGIDGTQNVTSYFIVDSSKVNNTTRGYAGAGVGVASAEPYTLSENPETLIDTLSKIFRNILSTSTSFVAPTVAVNVYNRAQVLTDVYIAMFQADENGWPRWGGNLKKFAIGTNNAGDPELQDRDGAFAVASDGRIKFEAISNWTIPGDLPAAPPPPAISDLVSTKDGRVIDRGGAGSKVPGFKLTCADANDQVCAHASNPGLTNPGGETNNTSARKLFTEPDTFTNGTPAALRALNADVATATALQSDLAAGTIGNCTNTDTTSPPTACYLLKYARGVDNDGAIRGWLMGDLLHSRPLAINYGARGSGSRIYPATNPDVRILVGSNDGFMRMIRNSEPGSTPAIAGTEDGVEVWGFMPRAVMPTIKTLADNQAVTPPHPYLTDNSPTAYVLDSNGNGNIEAGDKVYTYFGLRRGGKAYYALDIINPDNPELLWRITKGAAGTDFGELGQTWATPRVVNMLFGGNATSKPVVIFGGGYDSNKDTHLGHSPHTVTGMGADDAEGNAVYVVNAETGALIWKAVKGASTGYIPASKSYTRPDMKDSIPSTVLPIDTDGNGLVDRVYVGDTGGVVWRIDMRSADQANWIVTPILSVGRHVAGWSTSIPNDRRFFNPPDFAQSVDGTGPFDAIIIGSGDRENPRDTDVENWFYMFKDRDVTSGGPLTQNAAYPVTHSQLGDITSNCLQDDPGSCTVGTIPNASGWRMQLTCPPSNPATCGEKNLAPALTIGGTIFFTSYIPPGSGISGCNLSEGTGLLYAVSLQDGTAVEDFDAGNNGNPSGQYLFNSDRSTQLNSPGIPAEVTSIGGGKLLQPDLQIRDTKSKAGYKTFWYHKQN